MHAWGEVPFCMGDKYVGHRNQSAAVDLSTMHLKCEALRWLIIDEIENAGAELLAVLEMHVSSAANKKHYPVRPRTRGPMRPRLFGGINTLLCGDWWQLPPVRQVSLCSNPFRAPSHQAQKMLDMFWTRGPHAIQKLFELNQHKRSKDQWLTGFLAECRNGSLSWDNYNFMHGYPTLAPGSWMSATGTLQCENAACFHLWKERWPAMREAGIDWSIAQHLECARCSEERTRRCRLLSSTTDASDASRRAILNTAPYMHPCNWPKYQASQKRAVLFARAQRSQILWVRAIDMPNTT